MNLKINNLTVKTKKLFNTNTNEETLLISQADAFRIQQSFKKGKVKDMGKIVDESRAFQFPDSLYFPLLIAADKRENLIKCETTKSNLKGESK